MHSTPALPKSVVRWYDPVLALPVILGFFFVFKDSALSDVQLSIALVLALSFVMGAIELARAPWRSVPRVAQPLVRVFERAVLKLLGFFAGLSFIAFLYWLLPEYRRDYYDNFFEAARLIVPWLPVVCIPYFLYVEWRLSVEYKGSWDAAMVVLGKWSRVDWFEFSQYALGWLVKGFFLPIMFGDVANNMDLFRAADWHLLSAGFMNSFGLVFSAIIHLELVFVAAGYVFTCRLFDTHIRAVERTFFGWAIALMSYSPFLSLFYVRYFDYSIEGNGWIAAFGNYPTLLTVWGSIILVLIVLHLWCDAIFGLRFSNLTNRGIITNGPYRFLKHPAYVIKNIRWWLVSVPFIAISPLEGLRLSLLLVCVNMVYTLRSYAEERMLSSDPTYRAYALWMEEHSLLRGLGKRFPVFSYRWRLARWQKDGSVAAL